MSFDEEYMHGYTAKEYHMSKMADKAYSVLGNITQCVMFEFDSTGHAFLAANRADFGEYFIEKKMYRVLDFIIYGNAVDKKIIPYFSNPGINMMLKGKNSLLGEKFNDMENGFIYVEKLEDLDAYRMYGFSSDSKKIYNTILNDWDVAKKFITYFTEESKDVINYYRNRKFDLASQRKDYFNNKRHQSESYKEKIMNALYNLGTLSKKTSIDEKEWECFQLYHHGKAVDQIGEILGVSYRVVESHFDSLKKKLGVKSKVEIMEHLT